MYEAQAKAASGTIILVGRAEPKEQSDWIDEHLVNSIDRIKAGIQQECDTRSSIDKLSRQSPEEE